jgi:hypothetical protein
MWSLTARSSRCDGRTRRADGDHKGDACATGTARLASPRCGTRGRCPSELVTLRENRQPAKSSAPEERRNRQPIRADRRRRARRTGQDQHGQECSRWRLVELKHRPAYKAIMRGGMCPEVKEAYMTKTCSACGARSGPKGIADRVGLECLRSGSSPRLKQCQSHCPCRTVPAHWRSHG